MTTRERELFELELRRDSASVTEHDLSNRDVAVRRQAARALARIGDERAAELLRKSLADEDPEVLAWSAYGLGYACRRDAKNVAALVARAASLAAAREEPPSRLDPGFAIADALARCGSLDSELTLRAWLGGPSKRAEIAARALSKLAFRRQRLDDATLVALLDAASRPDDGLASALFAFTQLTSLSEAIQERLLGVAEGALARPGLAREIAVRALANAGPRAAPRLGELVGDRALMASERADAARGLARLGGAGQAALADALEHLAPSTADAQLLSAEFTVLRAVLEAIVPPAKKARKVLERLATLPIAPGTPPAVNRRAVSVRCQAASVLVGDAVHAPELRDCDPTPSGRVGSLAELTVLSRAKLGPARLRRWRVLLESSDPVVVEAALGVMAEHPEIRDPQEVMAAALGSGHDGVVTVAAQLLASYPDRASGARGRARSDAVRPDVAVVNALTEALRKPAAPDAVQRRAALIDAAGALQLLSLKPEIQAACASPNATLRGHAERALRMLGERTRRCTPKPGEPLTLPPPSGPRRLVLTTESGKHEIRLDPTFAPLAAARVAELARTGSYSGTVIHRAVPAFIVQLGDSEGDGHGAMGKPPLPCETAPVPVTRFSVGIAQSGRDSGSSQIFVALGTHPHLDGDFTLVGTGSSSFEKLTVFERVEKAELLP